MVTMPFAVGSGGRTMAVPSATAGTVRPVICIALESPEVSSQPPARLMPIGTTSYRSGSRAEMTLPAETTEMPCSLLRPPYTTATRIFVIGTEPIGVPLPTFALGRSRHQQFGNGARAQRSEAHRLDRRG